MNVNISLPDSFNRLTEQQLKNIAFIRYQQLGLSKELKGKALNALNENCYYKAIRELLRGNNFFKTLIALWQIPVSQYSTYTSWLFGKVDRTVFIPSIFIGKKKYAGPFHRLSNITVAEFSFADALWYNWEKSGEKKYLNMLCAALYRPAANGERLEFSKLLVEQQVSKFSKVPLKTKLAIALCYEGSRNQKVDLYPNVFPKRKLTALIAEQSPKPKYEPFGKLVSHKIGYDPSKLSEVENMLIDKFLGIYENELRELKSRKK